MREGQKAQDKESFFKVTPLIWAIEGQNNESYRGGWTFKNRRKFPLFEKFPTKGGEVGMVFHFLQVFHHESFPYCVCWSVCLQITVNQIQGHWIELVKSSSIVMDLIT